MPAYSLAYSLQQIFRRAGSIIIATALLCGGFFCLKPAPVGAFEAQATLEHTTVVAGEMTTLAITVTGGKPSNPPEIEQVAGLQIRSSGTSQQIQIINGQFSSSIVYNYSVLALAPGEYTLGPFKLAEKKEEVTTNAVKLTVLPATAPSSPGTGGEEPAAPPPTGGRRGNLFLEVSVPKNRIYLGEKLPVTIILYVGDIRVREVSYPVLETPEFSFAQSGKPVERRRMLDGVTYQVVEFPFTLTAVKTGKFTLGPAELQCSVLTRTRRRSPFPDFFDDFFSDFEYQPVTLQSNTWELEVVPLPAAGQPADFSGGVGRFTLEATANPQEVEAGEPVTVTLTVKGTGNFATLSAPVLRNPDGFKIYDAQKKTAGESGEEQVVFEQVLIPLSANVDRIGSYELSYFDPEAGEYKVARSEAIPLTVTPGSEPAGTTAFTRPGRQAPVYGRDLVFIKGTPGRLRLQAKVFYRQAWYWWLHLLPLGALFAALYYRRRLAMLNSGTPKARALRATAQAGQRLKKAQALLAKGEEERFIDELHTIVREYLGERYNLPAAGMTGEVVTKLQAEGLSEDRLKDIKEFFAAYDFYRFTGRKPAADEIRRLQETAGRILAGG